MDSDRTGTGRVGCCLIEWAESVYQEMMYQEMTFFWCTGVEKHIKMNKKMTGVPYFDEFLSHRSLLIYIQGLPLFHIHQ